MNAADFFADRVLPYQNQQISMTFGGPVREDRVHFFGYYEYEREPQSYFFDSIVPAWNDLGNGPDGTGVQYTGISNLWGGRMDFQATDQTRLMGRVNGYTRDSLRRPDRSTQAHPSTLMDQSFDSLQAYGTLTRAAGTSVNELKVGYNYFVWQTQSFLGDPRAEH